ncbi:MAG TPA: glycosyltransferase family 2 protein [Gemmatimonadaceae bacterium]|nr:glycosyltransferase family 2 protein [Gemmatimonadaceae bacterium]
MSRSTLLDMDLAPSDGLTGPPVAVSVVTPVYGAEECLHELYTRLIRVLEPLGVSFEIIMVDDASPDRGWDTIRDIAATDGRVRGFRLSRNYGQHHAITAGLDLCRGDHVIIMDCDLQDAPEDIPALLAKASEGFDIVIARRTFRDDPLLKRLTSRVFYAGFRYLSDMPYDAEIGNFRVVTAQVVQTLRRFPEQLRFFGGLCMLVGFRVGNINVTHHPRFAGKSSYSYRKLFQLATRVIIAYSDKPLRLAIRLGFFLTGSAMAAAAYLFWRALTHDIPVSGWASLIVSIYFLGGVMLFMLGIVGVYLGRVFDEVKRRPLYVIASATQADSSIHSRASLRATQDA